MNAMLRRILCLFLALTMIGSPLSISAEGLTDEPEEAEIVEETTEPDETEPEETEPEETEPGEEELPGESVPMDEPGEDLPGAEIQETFGKCGDNLTWVMDDEGTLTISGTGDMWDYSTSEYSPWGSPKAVIIEEGVTSIGEYAFYRCRELNSVTISSSVKRIGGGTFSECLGISRLNISSLQSWLKLETPARWDYHAFPIDVYLNGELVQELVIPEGTKKIDDYAFLYWGFKSVRIPDSVVSIGAYAFSRCINLSSVTIPDSVESVGEGAFERCRNLVHFQSGKKMTVIPAAMFSGCYWLREVSLLNGITSIGDYAFSSCSRLTSITLPDSVTSIGAGAFSRCSALDMIALSKNTKKIGNEAFSFCYQLKTVAIPDSVTTLGDEAFAHSGLQTVSIGSGVTDLGRAIFGSCSELESLTLGNGITMIGDYMFDSCSKLTQFIIPNSVKKIGHAAFTDCTNLTEVIIPDSVMEIGTSAFSQCTNLKSVSIGKGAAYIGSGCFHGCDSLESVTLSANNTMFSLKDGVLYSKDQSILYQYLPLKNAAASLVIPSTVTRIEEYAFYKSALQEVYIPASVITVCVLAFYGSALQKAVIYGSETVCNPSIFDECWALRELYFAGRPPVVTEWWFQFFDNPVTIYYPESDPTWPEDAAKVFVGDNITWVPFDPATLPQIEQGSVGEAYYVDVPYPDSFSSAMKTTPILYSDNFFAKPSTVFQMKLAKISLGGAMAATTYGSSRKDENGTVHPVSAKKATGSIKSFLTQIGCPEESIYTQKFDINHTFDDTVAFAMGCKPLPDGTYLVPVFIRGAGYGAGGFGGEWASNFRVWDNSNPNYSAGFKRSADKVYDYFIGTYLPEHLPGVPLENIKVWTTGFSRAAAVSSLIAARLTSDSGIPLENIYSYNFATPGNVKAGTAVAYDNINHIVSEQDLVPRVPLMEESWNFRRFGHTYYLPSITNRGVSYLHWKNEMAMHYKNLTGMEYVVGDYQETTFDLLFRYLTDIASDPSEYSRIGIQDAIVQRLMSNKAVMWFDIFLIFMNRATPRGQVLAEFTELFENWKNWSAMQILNQCIKITAVATGHGTAATKFVKDLAVHLIAGVEEDSYNIVAGMITGDTIDTINESANARYFRLADLLSDLLADHAEKTETKIFMQHTEEAYLCWLKVAEENSNVLSTTGHTLMSVKCPVDVEVYNESGQLVCRIVDDKVDKSIEGLYAYVENGEKYIYIPEFGTYNTVVTAREDGEVSIVTTTYNADRERQNTTGYVDLEMEAGQVFEVNDSNIVTTEGQTLEQDLNYWGKQEVTMAVSVEGPGAIIGDGTYNVGESAMLYAVPDENSVFLGWYDEAGQRISGEDSFAYLMMEDAALTARFCDAEAVEAAISQNYLAMKPGDTARLNIQVEPAELQELLTLSVENADKHSDEEIITVDEDGNVTAMNPGTAYVIAEVTLGGEPLRSRCRIDVVGGESEHPIAAEVAVNGAALLDAKAAVELFKTDYAKVGILLNFAQNMSASSTDAAPADQGAAIEGARFSDDALNGLLRLRVKDDRTLEIIPTEEAIKNPASVKGSYKSTVKVTVDGSEFETAPLTLTVKKSQPNIKAAAVKINTFDSISAPVVFTGGKVTALRADTLPADFTVEGMNIVYTGSAARTSAKLNLMAQVEGFAVEKAVTVSVSVARTEPTVKLKPASVTLLAKTADEAQAAVTIEEGRELEMTLLDSTGSESDVLNCVYQNGIITVSVREDAAPGTYKLAVNAAGSSKKANLTIKVVDKNAALSLKVSGAIDTAIPGSPIAVTTRISGFHAGTGERYSITVSDGTEDVTGLFNVRTSGNVLTFTAAGEIPRGTYTAQIGADLNNDGEADCEKSVKLPVKWSAPSKVPVSVTLKASGKIDVVKTGTAIVVKPTIKNWFLHELSASDLVFYKAGVKLEEAPFKVTIEDGAYVITNNGADSSAKYTVAFSAEIGGKTVTSKPVTLGVKMSAVKPVQSTKAVTLLKKDRYDSVIVHLDIPEGFTGIKEVKQDQTSSALYTVTDLGRGDYAISFAGHKAAAKGAAVKLQVFLKGNLTEKPNATVSIKVTLK